MSFFNTEANVIIPRIVEELKETIPIPSHNGIETEVEQIVNQIHNEQQEPEPEPDQKSAIELSIENIVNQIRASRANT